MRYTYLLPIFALSVIAACDFSVVRPDTVEDDATIAETCALACENMKRVGFPGFDGSPTGTPCKQVCIDTEDAGYPFHARCIAESATAAAIQRCYDD